MSNEIDDQTNETRQTSEARETCAKSGTGQKVDPCESRLSRQAIP